MKRIFTKYAWLVLVMLFTQHSFATLYEVGPGKTYATPAALYAATEYVGIYFQDGDIVEIDAAGTYVSWDAVCTFNGDNMIIRGVNGRPHLDAQGVGIKGKGIFVIGGDNCVVENIEFSGAEVVDENGAGIRLDGLGLTVRNCYFHDNENGILVSNTYAGDMVVEYCEFRYNGLGEYGKTHNMYIGHINSFTIRYSYSHHAYIGHNVKTRAENNYILYNRLMDEADGRSSYLLDIPNGGFSVVIGNLFMQGPLTDNSSCVAYGQEGLSNATKEFYFVNNTIVNDRSTGTFVRVSNSPTVAKIYNNVMLGNGTAITYSTDASNNVQYPDTTGLELADKDNYDYRIGSGSVLRDAGVSPGMAGSYDLTPQYHYTHPYDQEDRILDGASIDIGAYEYVDPLSIPEPEPEPVQGIAEIAKSNLKVFQNSLDNMLLVEFDNADNLDSRNIQLIDMTGNVIQSHVIGGSGSMYGLNISHVAKGLYVVQVSTGSGYAVKKVFIR